MSPLAFSASPRHQHVICGFTLIELLVVISVIALLIAILMPALQHARETATAIDCKSRLRQIGIGMHLYAQDYGSHLPYWPPQEGRGYKDCWDKKVAPYINYEPNRDAGDGLMHCPTQKGKGVWGNNNTPGNGRGYMMNTYVAKNLSSFEQNRLDQPWTDNRQMVLFDSWMETVYDVHGPYQMPTFSTARNSYLNPGQYQAFAYRHLEDLNFWRKDGSVAATGPGKSGQGADMIWGYSKNDVLVHDGAQ